ncbi:MAG TPA: hypothetical protein VFB84_12385 [Micromonosporaceae bacterium]|nr:hypothetical protein [Micromonosporaceae bacterium]
MEQSSELTVEIAQPWVRPVVLVPVFVLLSAVGGLFRSFSLEANLYVLAIGGTLFWLGLSSRVPRRSVPLRLSRSGLWWLVPALTLAIVELVTFVRGSSYDYPTLSLLADPLFEGYLARTAGYFGWVTAFWGLIRR